MKSTPTRHKVTSALELALSIVIVFMVVWAIVTAATAYAQRAQDCFDKAPTFVGTNQADIRLGNPGRDVVRMRAGGDTYAGLGESDRVCGGRGDDTLDGGPGFDRIDGGPGYDKCSGERIYRCEEFSSP